MGIKDDIGDPAFNGGMLHDASDLGDKGTSSSNGFIPDWIPAFKQDIHGLILVSGDCHASVAEKLAEIEEIFSVRGHDATIHEVIRIVGDVRPGKEKGHEQYVLYLPSKTLLNANLSLQLWLSRRHLAARSPRCRQ